MLSQYQDLTLLKAWIFINKKIIIYIFRLNSLYRFLKWEFNSSYLGKKQYWWKNYCNCTRFNLIACWSWNFWAYLHRGFKIWIKSKLLAIFFWSFFNNKKFEFWKIIPCDPILKKPEILKICGPRAFGYNIDYN